MALEDTAKRLIQKHGRRISLRVTTQVLDDPAKPWGPTTDSVKDTNTYGVFIDENASDLEARVSAVSRVVISPIEVNGVQVYIAGKGLSVVPSTAMKLVDGDRVLEIKKVGKVTPGAVPYLYICQVEN